MFEHTTSAHCVLDRIAPAIQELKGNTSVMGNSTVPNRLLPKPIFEITQNTYNSVGRSLSASFVYSKTDDDG